MPKKTISYDDFIEMGEKLQIARNILVTLTVETSNKFYKKYGFSKAIDIIDQRRSDLEDLMYKTLPRGMCSTKTFYGNGTEVGAEIYVGEYKIVRTTRR